MIQKKEILLESYNRQKSIVLNSIEKNRLYAILLLFTTVVFTYGLSDLKNPAFITALILLLLQVFSTQLYKELLQISQKIKLINYGINPPRTEISYLNAAGFTVKESYFILFLIFDITWLLNSYIFPSAAESFSEYLSRLTLGNLSGESFLIFTFFFWIFYISLYFIGNSYKKEILIGLDEKGNIQRTEFSIVVINFLNEEISISGFRLSNPDKQPLILFPGFFQNGFFYDISPPDISIAEFLWKKGYDIWIFHPRGTASSKFSKVSNSMDDYASNDIPSIIDFVLHNTGKKPIFIGHSQGGISALISLMGASKTSGGEVFLSEKDSINRQDKLKGLVTLGSYLNFSFSKPSMVQNFIRNGFTVNIFRKKIKIVSSDFLLNLISIFNRVPVPVPFALRIALANNKPLRIILFPLALLLNIVSLLGVWQFLYNIPNVNRRSRIYLFYRTIDATFWGILDQFHQTIKFEKMFSSDKKVNYSDNYSKIKLPVSIVTMEYDTLADPVETKRVLFLNLDSKQKYFTEWMGQGHEDFVMNSAYFHQVLNAIKIIDQ